MSNKVKIWLVGLVVAMAVVIASATPAQASWGGCPFGTFCTYWDSNGNGSVYYYSPAPSCITVGAPWNTNISSVWNHTADFSNQGYYVTVYKNSTCSGLGWVITASNYGNMTFGWNDQVHSLWFQPS